MILALQTNAGFTTTGLLFTDAVEPTRLVTTPLAFGYRDTPRLHAQVRRRTMLDRLRAAFEEAQTHDWDGLGARPANPSAFRYALQALDALAEDVPVPEITVDADGDIGFEWGYGARRVLEMRVAPDGTVNYAGLVGYAAFHGSEVMVDGIPPALLSAIGRVVHNTARGG